MIDDALVREKLEELTIPPLFSLVSQLPSIRYTEG